MADRERIAGQLPGADAPLNPTEPGQLAGRLLAAAAAFHRAARSPDPSPSTVAVARALDALWLAFHRDDAKALLEWERAFYKYTDAAREEGERWTGLPLPPRARLDRLRAVEELQRVTALLAIPQNEPEAVGEGMASTVALLFPSLCAAPGGKIDGDKRDRAAVAIAAAFRAMVAEQPVAYRHRPLPPEPLLLAALEVFGVPRPEVHNWLKGAKP